MSAVNIVKVESQDPISSTKSALPSFMGAAWAKTFLPTLYDSLGRSEKPFSHFSKGPEIVEKIQQAINLVWVGTDYRVRWTDEVCLKVSCIYTLIIPS